MSGYLNNECPYCNKIISAEDELVVCPDCGTPHHRSCYFEHNECFNQSRHAEGFEWAPPAGSESGAIGNEITCQSCGRLNRADSVFCNYCGNPVNRQIAPHQGAGASYGEVQPSPVFMNAEPEQPALALEDEVDGISVRDWVAYIGPSYNYYLYSFKVQDRAKRKIGFTFSAFVLPYVYFLYRKLWSLAAVSFAVELLFSVPSFISLFLQPMGYTVLGLSPLAWERIAGITASAYIVVKVVWALFAVWFYRKHSVKRIERVKAESAAPEGYQLELKRAGGVSRLAVLIFAVAFVGFTFLYTLFELGMVA